MRFSIRKRIAVALVASFLIVIPTAFISLYQQSLIMASIKSMIDEDVHLGHVAADLSIKMLESQQDEWTYRLYGRAEDMARISEHLVTIDTLLDEAGAVADTNSTGILADLVNSASIYRNSFNTLVKYRNDNPVSDRRHRYLENLSIIQKDSHAALSKLDMATGAELDSLILEADRLIDSLTVKSLDNILLTDDEDIRGLLDNLDISRTTFLNAADALTNQSRILLSVHKEDVRKLEARARRNIISLLIVAGIVCMVMVMYIPRYLVRPITHLTVLFHKISQGTYDVKVPEYTDGEIGGLVESYSSMIKNVRQYDEMKSRKIASQKRTIDRLIEQFDDPVIIINDNMIAMYYNAPFARRFDGIVPAKVPMNGLNLIEVYELDGLVKEIGNNLKSGGSQFSVQLDGHAPDEAVYRGLVIRDSALNLERIILIGSPETKEQR